MLLYCDPLHLVKVTIESDHLSPFSGQSFLRALAPRKPTAPIFGASLEEALLSKWREKNENKIGRRGGWFCLSRGRGRARRPELRGAVPVGICELRLGNEVFMSFKEALANPFSKREAVYFDKHVGEGIGLLMAPSHPVP